MGTAVDYKKELTNLTKELPESKLSELLDFAQFLKAKSKGVTYMEVRDSAEYVRKLRAEEGKRVKSGKNFIKELIEWQKSNS